MYFHSDITKHNSKQSSGLSSHVLLSGLEGNCCHIFGIARLMTDRWAPALNSGFPSEF